MQESKTIFDFIRRVDIYKSSQCKFPIPCLAHNVEKINATSVEELVDDSPLLSIRSVNYMSTTDELIAVTDGLMSLKVSSSLYKSSNTYLHELTISIIQGLTLVDKAINSLVAEDFNLFLYDLDDNLFLSYSLPYTSLCTQEINAKSNPVTQLKIQLKSLSNVIPVYFIDNSL